jgi:UDP-glucose 4-epimerase
MRIAVTGASGNVGTALLRRLQADGGYDVTGIARRRPPPTEPYDSARWQQVDLSTTSAEDRLTEAFQGLDAIVHLAWMIQPSHDRALMRATNQGGTRAVAAAARAAGVPHLVHMSSVGTYAAAPGQWKNEEWSTAGVATSSYSVDKAACEALLDDVRDMRVTRVRPGLILQPAAASEISRYFLGPLVPIAPLRSLVRYAPLPRSIAIQFVHTDDVADALVRIIQTKADGAFNLAAAPVIDRDHFRQIFGGIGPPLPARLLRAAADVTWRAHLQPTDAGWLDLGLGVPLMETSRAETELGWRPAHSTAEFLPTFVDALSRGRGGTGPLLYPRRAKDSAQVSPDLPRSSRTD